MSTDRKSIPVSLPEGLVDELDELVEEGKFGSRSEALRYGARLVAREAQQKRMHDRRANAAEQDIEDRLERKRVR
ncbi:ribbon-helix-helix domain-containing protein [Natrarchaeobius oligotrophus]|uniref:Ribbon-helix-helix protein, CopG family n=1 Tax=Natrarchaeobius chitinivorans TaxID=1679083 RepID=A0A3N6PMY9_NATCH|nr:ribbon-helix-helix domain-containing protein [Natrarchaeobius chitinivorans]RQH00426.1 ribbon-helix-helix protein, CopG family [Natrarchaeobius chitinivorans]